MEKTQRYEKERETSPALLFLQHASDAASFLVIVILSTTRHCDMFLLIAAVVDKCLPVRSVHYITDRCGVDMYICTYVLTYM